MMKQLILALTMLLAFTASHVHAEKEGWQSPLTVEGSEWIDLETAVKLHGDGVPFIDVRSERYFKKRHIKGAYHLDLKSTLTEENLLNVVGSKDDKWFVIYCNGAHCSLSYRSIEKAVKWGFKKIYYFRDGFRAWRIAGHPIETGLTQPN